MKKSLPCSPGRVTGTWTSTSLDWFAYFGSCETEATGVPNVEPEGHESLSVLTMTCPWSWAKHCANLGSDRGGKSLLASLALVYTSATSNTFVFSVLAEVIRAVGLGGGDAQGNRLVQTGRKIRELRHREHAPRVVAIARADPCVARLRPAVGQIGQLQQLRLRVWLVGLDRACSGRDGGESGNQAADSQRARVRSPGTKLDAVCWHGKSDPAPCRSVPTALSLLCARCDRDRNMWARRSA